MKILMVYNTKINNDLEYFKAKGFIVENAENFMLGFEKLDSNFYDCIVLSPYHEEKYLLQLLEKLSNERRQDGIVILYDNISKEKKLDFFSKGADDVLQWPLDEDELTERIKAIIRRKKFNSKSKLYFANLVIDFELRKVFVWNSPINLTKKEYEILLHLIANKNRVVSKDSLAGYLWNDNAEKKDTYDFLFAHLKNLKRKLREAKAELMIKNIYGVGYQIEEL